MRAVRGTLLPLTAITPEQHRLWARYRCNAILAMPDKKKYI